MLWFRWYQGTCADPKLGSIARRAGTSRERVIATWAMILESATDTADHGRFRIDADGIADVLNCDTVSISAILAIMQEVGMLSGGVAVAFSRRNFDSDCSTERVRKHRERSRNGVETFQDRDVTAPEAEAEAEADSKAETNPEEHPTTPPPHATAAAVGEFCTEVGVSWPIKEAIDDWSGRLDREPRFAGLDLAYEIRKCAGYHQANHRHPKPNLAILNWLERSETRTTTNGNSSHRTTAVQQYDAGIQSPEEVVWKR